MGLLSNSYHIILPGRKASRTIQWAGEVTLSGGTESDAHAADGRKPLVMCSQHQGRKKEERSGEMAEEAEGKGKRERGVVYKTSVRTRRLLWDEKHFLTKKKDKKKNYYETSTNWKALDFQSKPRLCCFPRVVLGKDR